MRAINGKGLLSHGPPFLCRPTIAINSNNHCCGCLLPSLPPLNPFLIPVRFLLHVWYIMPQIQWVLNCCVNVTQSGTWHWMTYHGGGWCLHNHYIISGYQPVSRKSCSLPLYFLLVYILIRTRQFGLVSSKMSNLPSDRTFCSVPGMKV